VNQGEPAHDDYGLPRVDIEIPDDARELYRDVQAYHRELRALRRHERSLRWRSPLRRTGVILPLAAGFLILALISGMVLTIVSTDPYFSGFSRPSSSKGGGGLSSDGGLSSTGAKAGPVTPTGPASATAPASSATASSATAPASSQPVTARTAERLPGTTIKVAGRALALRSLTSTALAMVPANCGCVAAVRQLIAQARQARVLVYLVGLHSSRADLAKLASVTGPNARMATDARNVLSSAYQPAGLTVLLVDAHGSVRIASRLGPVLDLTAELQLLRSAR
jgi:hypothetical protein